MSECKHEYFQAHCEDYFRCSNCSDVFDSYDLVQSLAGRVSELEEYNLGLALESNNKSARIAHLEDMLDVSWLAVCEAGYEGYDPELRKFMEDTQ